MKVEEVVYTNSDLDEPPFNGRRWKRRGTITSVYANGILHKSAKSFQSIDQAYETAEICKEKGLSGYPSTPASVFTKVFEACIEAEVIPYPKSKAAKEIIGTDGQWLWIEKRVKGRYSKPVYYMDMNRAYLWGSMRGLPQHVEPYTGQKHYVGLMDVRRSKKDLPNTLNRQGPIMVSEEDEKYYGLKGDWKCRVGYDELNVDLSIVFELIRDWFGEWIEKKCSQMYWGTFAADEGAVQETFKAGEKQSETTTGSRFTNPVWATLITHRVMRRLHGVMRNGGLSCFVDSCISPYKVRTGEKPGKWSCDFELENGIYIKAPGIWDSLPRSTLKPTPSWKRHSGIVSKRADRSTSAKMEEYIEDRMEERMKTAGSFSKITV